MWCVLDEAGTDGAECRRKVANERNVAGAIMSLSLFLFLMFDSETMLRKEKERSRIRAVQMDNLRGLLGIRRMDRVLNGWIR